MSRVGDTLRGHEEGSWELCRQVERGHTSVHGSTVFQMIRECVELEGSYGPLRWLERGQWGSTGGAWGGS